MAFEPRPTFNAWNRQQQIGLALDTPFTFTRTLGEQFMQGALDSFGLGSVIRSSIAGDPRARTGPEGLGAAIREVGEAFGWMHRDTSKVLTEEEWKSSPYFRTDLGYDAAMTEDRAAALADMYDTKKVREHFSAKQPIASFLGQLGGQVFDPINYVPVFGPAVKTAAVAKFGGVGGRALLSASDAAINTAAFGLLTAGVRGKYGDDVSFAAITSDIAMSALIGGIFGTGAGVLARGADRRAMTLAKARPKLETLGNTMEARAALNDAVGGLVERGEVALNPNSLGVVEKMRDEIGARTAGVRRLRDETAAVTGSKPGEVVIAPSGARVAVRPEVVELSSLVRASGALQVRDRSSAASAAQVEDIAINLDPARLMPNVDGSQGAPLVGPDNIVDSGNGRTMALQRAYEAYPQKAAEYRAALEAAGYSTEGMQQPVLINRRLTELSDAARVQFNGELNTPTTARMSAVELAAMDREALDDATLNLLDAAPVTAASNRAFRDRFLQNLPLNERAALLERDNRTLNADGARRIENALVAAAYGDVDAGVLRRFAEATDDNTRAIVGAMSDVAGDWARMRAAIKRGEVGAEFDLTPELTQALRLLGRWREDAAREGRPVATVIREGLAQLDLLSGEVSPEAQTFIRMFYENDHFGRAVGRETLAARLRTVAESTLELGRPSLFGDALIPSKGEVLSNAQREQADIFAADGLEPRAQEDRGAGEGRAAEATGGFDRPGVEGGDTLQGIADAFPPAAVAEKVRTAREFVASQPARSLDETYDLIPALQEELHAIGVKLSAEFDAVWKNPGIKSKAGAADKMVRKGYESTHELTDLVRGGFLVKTAADADAIVARLRGHFDVLDEGWVMTAANYFDRKALVRFDDGTIGEVQFWHPDLFDAKDGAGGGHLLYDEWRKLPKDDPRSDALFAAQRRLYEAAWPVDDPAWASVLNGLLGRSSTPGNATRSAASLIGRPESTISGADASFQPEFDLGTNQPVDPTMTAARPSQSKNAGFSNRAMGESPHAINGAEPAPDPVPEGLPEAEARVGKGEDIRQLAEVHGVKEDGSFVEQLELDQMRKEGRLTPEDEAELAAAEQLYDDADAWAKSLEVAGRCMI